MHFTWIFLFEELMILLRGEEILWRGGDGPNWEQIGHKGHQVLTKVHDVFHCVPSWVLRVLCDLKKITKN